MVGFYKHKICRKETKRHKINYIAIFIIHIHLLSFSTCNPSQCLAKPADKINCINETVKFKLKLNYGLSLYMLSTNWARVQWGITPLVPCTNTKNYWSARNSCASNIRNCMSYANYAATN